MAQADPDGTEEGKVVVSAGLGLGRVMVDPIQDHIPSTHIGAVKTVHTSQLSFCSHTTTQLPVCKGC